MVQSLWERVEQFLRKFNMHPLYKSRHISPLGIYSREKKAYVQTKMLQMFIAAVFVAAPDWKLPPCSSAVPSRWAQRRVFCTRKQKRLTQQMEERMCIQDPALSMLCPHVLVTMLVDRSFPKKILHVVEVFENVKKKKSKMKNSA